VNPPVALTVAGSDSGGGAGIQVDLKTFAALRVFGTSAITALTAQNTVGVRGMLPTPPEFVAAQIEAVLDDLPVAAVKTGFLASAGTVATVGELAAAGRLPNLVVDPVLVSSTGARLLTPDAERLYVEALLPHAVLATPNLLEAQLLAGAEIGTLAEQREAARAIAALGPRHVVVKGGRAVTDTPGEAVDVLWDGTGIVELRAPRTQTVNNHGSGCTFAAAVTAHLARGDPPPVAVRQAKEYVSRAVERAAAWTLGAGHGPLNHFGGG
jgi:hydroxymethylpyrimidine/phosphomethylpyrimidine kinase